MRNLKHKYFELVFKNPTRLFNLRILPGPQNPCYNESNSGAIAGVVVGNFSLLQAEGQSTVVGPTKNLLPVSAQFAISNPFSGLPGPVV